MGGHRGTRIYGRLDCPAALRAIARGGYVRQRVFFLDERQALAAGYRPCAVCLPEKYRSWKKERKEPRLKQKRKEPRLKQKRKEPRLKQKNARNGVRR